MKKNEFLKGLKDLQTENKDVKELYMEVSALAMKYLSLQWKPYTGRAAYYFSIEYLMGRMFYNNLMELGVAEQVKEIFAKKGVEPGYQFLCTDTESAINTGFSNRNLSTVIKSKNRTIGSLGAIRGVCGRSGKVASYILPIST